MSDHYLGIYRAGEFMVNVYTTAASVQKQMESVRRALTAACETKDPWKYDLSCHSPRNVLQLLAITQQ